MRIIHKHSRGVSLVEAMVALAVMAFGMLAVVGVQSTLRFNADVARQRSEATRIAQERLDELRSFTAIDTGPVEYTWAGIANDVRTANGLNAVYQVRSEVVVPADSQVKVIRVTVSWADRGAANANDLNQRVVLASSIAAAAPALSGTLAVRPGTAPVAPVRRPMKRHPTIPPQARDLGNGMSAFVPPGRPWMALVFNNVTGVINGVCTFDYSTSSDNITINEIQSCANTTTGQLLSGFVRFERSIDGPDLTAADVENPAGPALNLRMHVDLTSTGHPQTPLCFDDMTGTIAVAGSKQFATYYCVIFSNLSQRWSGSSTIEALGGVDWNISDNDFDPQAHLVCRYTTATSDNQTVPNQDHPRDYSNLSGNLTDQNFVVISARKHCPTDVPADPANGDFVNSNTLQHQPPPI
ncbi:MAG TPA: prepilin-type N-terminal cleavage/methylation domain-containing protein [Burkholderiaceae bacterium]|nr:prepilin-type N-terminal cleavage/methylation domain-containing protein [Burkholderiaceae bacterium]